MRTINGGIPQSDLHLTALIEGSYNQITDLMVSDTVTVQLRNQLSPYGLIDSAKGILSITGICLLNFNNAGGTDPYYIVLKHRNSVETWSAYSQYFSGYSLDYDFIFSENQAYGNNMKLKGLKYCIFSGDVDQNGIVDLTDVLRVYNDASSFVSGYKVTDLTGDNLTDLTDLLIAYNNSAGFVSVVKP